MLSKSLIDVSGLHEKLFVLLVIVEWSCIIVSILHILMVRNVVVHGAVPRLRNELVAERIPFFLCSAVDALFYDRPSEVIIGQLSFLNRPCGRERSHYTSKWKKHVMQIPSMVNGLALVGNL